MKLLIFQSMHHIPQVMVMSGYTVVLHGRVTPVLMYGAIIPQVGFGR
jgi:hypothetical protein